MSRHALTGLILGLRDICPGFFLLCLLLTLLCPKQSGLKSCGISKPPCAPTPWTASYHSDGHFGACRATLGYGTVWLACKVPGPLFFISCRWHGGPINMLTMLWDTEDPLLRAQFELFFRGRRPTCGLVWLLPCGWHGQHGLSCGGLSLALFSSVVTFQTELKGWPVSYRDHLQKATVVKWRSNMVLHANDPYSRDSLSHTCHMHHFRCCFEKVKGAMIKACPSSS